MTIQESSTSTILLVPPEVHNGSTSGTSLVPPEVRSSPSCPTTGTVRQLSSSFSCPTTGTHIYITMGGSALEGERQPLLGQPAHAPSRRHPAPPEARYTAVRIKGSWYIVDENLELVCTARTDEHGTQDDSFSNRADAWIFIDRLREQAGFARTVGCNTPASITPVGSRCAMSSRERGQ